MLSVPALALLFALNKFTPSDILWVLKFFSKIMFGLCLNTNGSLPGSPGGLLAGSGELGSVDPGSANRLDSYSSPALRRETVPSMSAA